MKKEFKISRQLWKILLSVAIFFSLCLQSTPGYTEKNSSLTLDKAYKIALVNNESIKISREKMRQREKDVHISTSHLYPQLSTGVSYIRQKEFSMSYENTGFPKNYGLWDISLNQHIYQLGKVWSGKSMSEYFFQSSRFRHIRQVRKILFQVTHRYYNILLAKRAVEIAKNSLKRAKRQLERALGRFNVGVITKTDVLRAKVQVAKAKEQLEKTKNNHHINLEELALELGINKVPSGVSKIPERHFHPASMEKLYQKGLKHRKDLKQAQKEVKATMKKIDWERADFFPNISLEGKYMQTDESDLYYGDYDDWRISLNISYPLFTGGERTASLQKAKSQSRQAKTFLERLKKEIRTQIRTNTLNIQTQKKVIDQLKVQVHSAQRNYRQVTAQFEEGLATAVDQVDAFTTLNESENLLAQAYYTYQLELVSLKLALGTFQTDLLKSKGVLDEY